MARTPDPAVRIALIEAAAELLAEGGPDASASAGWPPGRHSTMAVYTHFGSKDELVREVVKEAFARLHAELAAVARTDDPVADLAAAGDAYRRNALANAHLFRVMFSLQPAGSSPIPSGHQGPHDRRWASTRSAPWWTRSSRCVDAGLLAGDPDAARPPGLGHGPRRRLARAGRLPRPRRRGHLPRRRRRHLWPGLRLTATDAPTPGPLRAGPARNAERKGRSPSFVRVAGLLAGPAKAGPGSDLGQLGSRNFLVGDLLEGGADGDLGGLLGLDLDGLAGPRVAGGGGLLGDLLELTRSR